jgi:multimeric flavodoxin WrbA
MKPTATTRAPACADADRPLVLLASSRSKGNTAALVAAAFPADAGLIVDIAALQIGFYSYENRFAEDDFLRVVERGLGHSVWVIATPLYWYTMSAQAKTFLDRISDLLEFRKDLGRKLRGKGLAVLCSGEAAALPPHFAEPFELTAGYLGMRYLGHHYARMAREKPLGAGQRRAALQFARGIVSTRRDGAATLQPGAPASAIP